MAVTLTEAAARQVKGYLASHGGDAALRLGVKNTGCSGFAYIVDYAQEIGIGDQVFESRGIRLVVDADSLAYVDGTEVDFRDDGLNAAFLFHNPNVTAECGCGESFSVCG